MDRKRKMSVDNIVLMALLSCYKPSEVREFESSRWENGPSMILDSSRRLIGTFLAISA